MYFISPESRIKIHTEYKYCNLMRDLYTFRIICRISLINVCFLLQILRNGVNEAPAPFTGYFFTVCMLRL